jgi:hypothetical protein
VIVLVVQDTAADDARKALVARGFHPSLRGLS